MKNRKLKLVANVAGFDTVIAEVRLLNFASEVDVREWTDLVCPYCNEKPRYVGGYEVTCCPVCHKPMSRTEKFGRKVIYGEDGNASINMTGEARIFPVWSCAEHGMQEPIILNHWSKLKRVFRGTKEALNIPRLLEEKEEAVAYLQYLPVDEFIKSYVDATRKEDGEKGIVIAERKQDKARQMAINLFKCIVAVEGMNYVIIAKWKDTNEEVVALLERSRSGRIVFREIIPSNLVEVKETLFLDTNAISQEDVKEASEFIKTFIPKATPETFMVDDYRAQWKEGNVTDIPIEPAGEKVADIKAIMAMVKAKAN